MFIEDCIAEETNLINHKINLIASENLPSQRVFNALGSILSQRYSEGYPGKRYYAGNEVIDKVEIYAIEKACELFQCNFANVQPHSGSQANAAAIMAFCKPGDTILGMSLDAGGHLTHGAPFSFSGKFYHAEHYGVDENGYLDYEELHEKLYEYQPKLLIVGCSAYSRIIDYNYIRTMLDEYNKTHNKCYLMVDMAHIAGLVATGYHPTPLPYADVVTTTTHKTLRGPRGGLILWNNPEYTKKINSALFPGIQGGPNNALTAAKAICFEEALQPEFNEYIKQVIANMSELIRGMKEYGIEVITGGSDNHQCLINVRHNNLDGATVQKLLEEYNIICDKNRISGDIKSDSGIRLGTAMITTQGYKEEDCYHLGQKIGKIISDFSANK